MKNIPVVPTTVAICDLFTISYYVYVNGTKLLILIDVLFNLNLTYWIYVL